MTQWVKELALSLYGSMALVTAVVRVPSLAQEFFHASKKKKKKGVKGVEGRRTIRTFKGNWILSK